MDVLGTKPSALRVGQLRLVMLQAEWGVVFPGCVMRVVHQHEHELICLVAVTVNERRPPLPLPGVLDLLLDLGCTQVVPRRGGEQVESLIGFDGVKPLLVQRLFAGALRDAVVAHVIEFGNSRIRQPAW